MTDHATVANELEDLLGLETPPIGITFSDQPPDGVEAFDAPMSDQTPDGRSGRVPAGCVFWMEATERTFTTVGADHGNCSVGSLTHGLLSLEEAAGRADVAALVEAGWVTEDVFPKIPAMSKRPGAITYGPLASTPVDPDVVFIRLNGKQLMTLKDAMPELVVEGKPQCHIVAMAKEHGEVAASVGCMLSRVRTGMPSTEVTCAIPAARLAEVVDRVRETAAVDAVVAGYAAEDARRFG